MASKRSSRKRSKSPIRKHSSPTRIRKQSKSPTGTRKRSKSPIKWTAAHEQHCPQGEIPVEAYIRKAYIRSDGVKVAASKISKRCVKDVGIPGKRSNTLPEIDKDMLKNLGYSLSADNKNRHAALKKAVKKHDKNTIIWHLNNLKNISAYDANRDTFKKDMEYVQKYIR